MRHLYSLLFYLVLPFILLRLWWRGIKSPGYRERISERLGDVSRRNDRPIIWLHAVSVGETMAAKPLIDALLVRYPEHQLLVTNTTPTGSAQLQRLYTENVQHCYFPYDVPHAIERFLDNIKPSILIVMETELWPNLYHQCAERNIPIVLANARLSVKSSQGYQKVGSLVKPLLRKISYLGAQSQQDLERFLQLGAFNDKSGIAGNLKYQMTVPDDALKQAAELKEKVGERPVWIAASTHQGEDEQLLSVHKELLKSYPNLLMLLVPRHPERFEDVARLCHDTGEGVVLRSQHQLPTLTDSIWLIDSMGELILFYAVAEFAFIGGSLVKTGGHNPLEPAALQLACAIGPHTFNFTDIMDTLLTANAIEQIETQTELETLFLAWLNQPDLARKTGEAAHQVLQKNQGAVEHLMQRIEGLIAT